MLLGAGIVSAALFGCAVTPPSPSVPPPAPPVSRETPPPAVPSDPGAPALTEPETAGKPSEGIKETLERGKAAANRRYRVAASNSFTGIGKRLLAKGDADGAIRMLERSVGINPNDGPGYFYLAEAWLMKENLQLAEQFNRLARIHLRHDDEWTGHAEAQLERIRVQAP